MSGHGERPRDPDPAALAELARAFADEIADDGAEAGGGDATASSMPGTSAGGVDPDGSPPSGDAEAEIVTAQVPAVSATPPGPAILDADLPDVERPDAEAEIRIVEQEPPVEPEPSQPRIIRIDDYSGNVELGADRDAVDEAPSVGSAEPAPPTSPADEPPADEPPASGGAATPVTIAISDDELPDAVYVEGSLEGGRRGSIVIIDDDDTGDALAPDSERALRRGIEPRLRERRLAVRRAQGRRRLKIIGLVVGIVLVVVLTLAALGTFFVVRAENVEVYNAVYTDEEMLQDIIDDAIGTPVLLLDTTDYEDRIAAIPWVERASVRTDFPHGLVVEIREREAIATYQGTDQRFRVLDREGRVLDVLDLYPYAYVLVGGPDTPDLEPGEFAPQGFAAAAELAKNLTATVRGRVQLVEVTADGSRLAMYLDDGSTVFFGEARDLLAKLVRLEAVLTNGQDREPGLIDVSTADVTR